MVDDGFTFHPGIAVIKDEHVNALLNDLNGTFKGILLFLATKQEFGLVRRLGGEIAQIKEPDGNIIFDAMNVEVQQRKSIVYFQVSFFYLSRIYLHIMPDCSCKWFQRRLRTTHDLLTFHQLLNPFELLSQVVHEQVPPDFLQVHQKQ